MKFYDALRAELESVSVADWQSKLDALHEQNGTWTATAAKLGVSRRSLERWRFGYAPRGGGPRRHVDPHTFVGRIRGTFGKDRRAQVRAVDWRKLHVTGTIMVGKKRYPRKEHMHLGMNFTPRSIAAIVEAYVAADPRACQRALDKAMQTDYIPDGATTFENADDLHF